MSILATLAGGLIGGLLFGKKKEQPAAAAPVAMLQPTRDDAEAEAARGDRLRKRRGAAADMLVNGSSGAEAAFASPRQIVGS